MKIKLLTAFAVLAVAGVSTASLVPNGDFEIAGGGDWPGTLAAVGVTASFPTTGGNTGGYAQLDQTAAGWGGVIVSQVDATTGIDLATVGATAGAINTFTIDLIDFADNGAVGGMKVESWSGGVVGTTSGDVTFDATTSWDTYTFDYFVDVGATSLKFVPLLVVQPVGSSYGFDNVGVVPEPATLGLLGIAGGAMLFFRRLRRG